MVGLGRVPGRKSEAGSPGVPTHTGLGCQLRPTRHCLREPRAALPLPAAWGRPLSPGEEGAGPWDRLTGLHLGPQAHTQPWKRAPCERCAFSPEQRLSSPGASGPWGPLTEQAGWGVPPDQGSPAPRISPRQSRAGSAGAMASPPCGPGCEDGGDLGVLRTDRPQGVSSPGLELPVTQLSHQRPHRKGNSLFLRAWRRPRDSPSVFLRRPCQ